MKIQFVFLVSVVVCTALLFVLPIELISSEFGDTILTISTFLFGILAGFYIYVTTTDYTLLKETAAQETGAYISLYEALKQYDPTYATKIAAHIDEVMRHSFDFDFIDYPAGTQKEFDALRIAVREIPVRAEKTFLHEAVVNSMVTLINARQKLLALATRALSIFQWGVLVALALIVVGTLYGLRSGDLFFDLVTVIISSTVILILVLIRDIDEYAWNEKTFGFDVFESVFRAIEMLPYYPNEAIQDGTITPTERTYRLGIYTNHPDSFDRRIEIVGTR